MDFFIDIFSRKIYGTLKWKDDLGFFFSNIQLWGKVHFQLFFINIQLFMEMGLFLENIKLFGETSDFEYY